jgi:atypical dual specificity phosphatase
VLPRNFSWLVEGKLAGCARPETEQELEGLLASGIKAIVSLTGTPLAPERVRRLGFECLHEPVGDFHAPSSERLQRILDFIDKQNDHSKAVLVHCGEGMGRTGTVLAAYFISRGAYVDEAIRAIREKRPGSIESELQINALHEFESFLKSKRSQTQ